MEMEKKLVKIPANAGKWKRRSCEVVSFTDRRMLSWCKLLGAIIILLRGVDVLNELHHTMHHKPQNQKPDFLLDQGGSHKNGSRQGERNVVVARKIGKSGWRVAHCVVQLFKNRAQKAKPEVLCQSKATMAGLTQQKIRVSGAYTGKT